MSPLPGHNISSLSTHSCASACSGLQKDVVYLKAAFPHRCESQKFVLISCALLALARILVKKYGSEYNPEKRVITRIIGLYVRTVLLQDVVPRLGIRTPPPNLSAL